MASVTSCETFYGLFLLILLEFVVNNCKSFARPIAAKASFAT